MILLQKNIKNISTLKSLSPHSSPINILGAGYRVGTSILVDIMHSVQRQLQDDTVHTLVLVETF